MPRIPSIVVAAMLFAAVARSAAGESPLPTAGYGVSTIWQVGGVGDWDYLALEPGGTRLFVSHGDRVEVIDSATGRRTGFIANTVGVHGIAFAPELKRGYTSNGRANTVTAFALDSLRTIQESLVAGKAPQAILYEPRLQHVLTANAASNDIDVLDPMTLQVVASISLPGPPRHMATDAAGAVFVNIEADAGRLVAIDAKALKVKATWSLPGCSKPTGLAIDGANHRLFSVCANQVMAVTDSTTGKQVALVRIGAGPDAAAFDRDLGFVFSSNGIDGTLTVIEEDTPEQFRVVATVQTQKSARTMALDPATHKIFLPAARFGDAPPPSPDNPHPRPPVVPDSFVILVAEPK